MKPSAAKRSTLPPVRVEAQLREQAEQVLVGDESLSGLIESALRTEIAHRQARAAFLQRGIEAGARARATGQYRSADEVMGRLQGILTKAQGAAERDR
jgi:predicted transcriptional regulator